MKHAMTSGAVVEIPAGAAYWHGAAAAGWFSHLAVEIPAEGASSEWLKPAAEENYQKLFWKGDQS